MRVGHFKWICIGLFSILILSLTSCLEVKQSISINKDGSGDARQEFAIQNEMLSMPGAQHKLSELKGDLQGEGWNVEPDKDKDGKHFITATKKFKNISELNDDTMRYVFSSERKGFMKKSYALEIRQLKSSDAPFPYEVILKMPGNIEETSGNKISADSVKWNLQGFRKGTNLSAKSSAFAMPDLASLKESFDRVFNSMFYREAIVFLRDGNIWVMDSDGKNQRQLTKGNVRDFSVSKEGKLVFNKPKTSSYRNIEGTGDNFPSMQETFKVEDLNLYLLDITTGSENKLTTDNRSRRGVISPEGTRIIFEKADWSDPDYGCCGRGTWLLDLRDKTQKEVVHEIPFPSDIISRFSWINSKEWFGDFNYVWSDDETKIAFSRNYGKDWPYAYLLYLDQPSNPIHIGKAAGNFGIGIRASDICAEKLIFDTSEQDYGRDLYLFDTKTAKSRLLQKSASNGKFSPDCKEILFLGLTGSGIGGLWITDIEGSHKRQLYNGSLWSPSWSPAGKKVLFEQSSQTSGIFIINADGSDSKEIADNGGSPRWTLLPRITFMSPGIAKTIIFSVTALVAISMLFAVALIARKAVASKPKLAHRPTGDAAIGGNIFCTQCGSQNPVSASFCKKCGQKL